jgi:predicted negative regulator of RcsB-dependent stress response
VETHIRKPHDSPSTATVADWANSNRKTVATALGAFGVVVVVIVLVMIVMNLRSASAAEQFGAAMRTYDAPVNTAGQPLPPGTRSFATDAERVKQANVEFAAIADKYGMTTSGKNAKYMVGVTAAELGQNSTAETVLKDVASSWCSDRSSLANLALAHLYHQTGRDSDAIAIYNKLTAKPSTVVPAGLAQMELASLYESENKPAEAKKIYAQLKDKDSKSPAGEMAAAKLAGQPLR